jgi:hypothetical protein
MPATLAAVANVLGLPLGQLRAEMEAVRRGWRKKQVEKREVGPA